MESKGQQTLADFMYNLPQKFPTAHRQQAELMFRSLQERTELILDFEGLQASIDPSAMQSTQQDSNDEKINYEEIIMTCFTTHGALADLSTFKLRGFNRASADFPLMQGIKQLNSLTELDLSGNSLSNEMQQDMQLWALTELKTLKLDKMGLKELPPSIGRLKRLKHLSVSNNCLSTLPVTLGFCQSLAYLNISKNKFQVVPGIVLELQQLQDLRRLDNPLLKRWEGYQHVPHISLVRLKSTVKKTVYNPDGLQALCTRTVMTCHVDYWSEGSFPPLQCKMLDSYASLYTYCGNCHNVINTTANSDSEGWVITVMKLKFLGLRDVPFQVHSCMNCSDKIMKKYTDSQKQLVIELDNEYEEMMRQALKDEGMEYTNTRSRQNRRRSKKCAIM